jgi:hypothetical protein
MCICGQWTSNLDSVRGGKLFGGFVHRDCVTAPMTHSETAALLARMVKENN